MTARDVTTAPGWRWMERMVDTQGRSVVDVNTGRNAGIPVAWVDGSGKWWEHYDDPDSARLLWADASPDLTDPATKGCLLAMVREAWGDAAQVHVDYPTDREPLWTVWAWDGTNWIYAGQGPTEGEALAAALLAAPVPS